MSAREFVLLSCKSTNNYILHLIFLKNTFKLHLIFCNFNLQLQLETLRIGHDNLDIDEERKQVCIPTTEDGEEKSAAEPQTSSFVASGDKMSFPETTSQMIGWKSEVLQRKEVERNARGKQDIVKLFKWPREGV